MGILYVAQYPLEMGSIKVFNKVIISLLFYEKESHSFGKNQEIYRCIWRQWQPIFRQSFTLTCSRRQVKVKLLIFDNYSPLQSLIPFRHAFSNLRKSSFHPPNSPPTFCFRVSHVNHLCDYDSKIQPCSARALAWPNYHFSQIRELCSEPNSLYLLQV